MNEWQAAGSHHIAQIKRGAQLNILVAGAGGHAKVIIDAIRLQGTLNIIALFDPSVSDQDYAHGYPVLRSQEGLADAMTSEPIEGCVVGIGDNTTRKRVHAEMRDAYPDLVFPAVIHPAATIAESAVTGHGVFVAAGAVIAPGCRIEEGSLVNTGAVVDHDSVLHAFSSIAPGAVLGGCCQVGKAAHVGLGANLIHGITIGHSTVVGAGATVIRDVGPELIVVGTPAGKLRERNPDEPYL